MEIPAEEHREARSQQEWQRAQQRLLRYLLYLEIPPLESLQLTLEALELAMQAQERRPRHRPIPEAMRALRRLLVERMSSPEDPAVHEDHSEDNYLSRFLTRNTGLPAPPGSMPPLNRGSMVPEEVD